MYDDDQMFGPIVLAMKNVWSDDFKELFKL